MKTKTQTCAYATPQECNKGMDDAYAKFGGRIVSSGMYMDEGLYIAYITVREPEPEPKPRRYIKII